MKRLKNWSIQICLIAFLVSPVLAFYNPGESHKEDEEHKHSRHKNHDADKHESHSEFKAEYHFVCKNPDRLSEIDVNLFHVFPGIEHIEVQLLTGTGQTALELTPKKKKITF